MTRREILRDRPGIPREISRNAGYPRGSLRQLQKVRLQVQEGEVFMVVTVGRAGVDPERGAAEERRSCPTPQPAPDSLNHPAALPEASPARHQPRRAGQLHPPWVGPGDPRASR